MSGEGVVEREKELLVSGEGVVESAEVGEEGEVRAFVVVIGACRNCQ